MRIQPPAFFSDALQVPPVYAQMFWEAIVRVTDDVEVGAVRIPSIDFTPEFPVRVADASSSSLDSSVLRELLLTQNDALNREMQDATYVRKYGKNFPSMVAVK